MLRAHSSFLKPAVIAAIIGAYKIRQLAKDVERSATFSTSRNEAPDAAIIEGYVRRVKIYMTQSTA